MVSSEDRLIECAWPAAAGDDQCVVGAHLAAVELDLSGSWVDAADGVGVRLYAGGGQGGLGGFEQADGDGLVDQHPVVRLFAAAGEESISTSAPAVCRVFAAEVPAAPAPMMPIVG